MDVLEALECLYLLTQFLASIQNKKQFIFNEFFSDAWSGKDSHGERLQNGWVLKKPKAGRINVCKSVFPREWSKENSFKSSNTLTFVTFRTRLLLAQRRVYCKWIYLLWICYISELFICIIFADYIWECQFYILGMTAIPKIPVRRIWIIGLKCANQKWRWATRGIGKGSEGLWASGPQFRIFAPIIKS